ncbi:MAG: purine/pyrimidine permease [Nitrososphaerota archaeon]|jgi:xanthine/uracil permease|nr:purine/pyrimidine permease [Nitrososphaerota archaeon]MDG6927306.1 purine/pyrimidine permease [Nitrososphaerota archaeon]MDG6930336.1 purine/pyrimidine permease [Nitrososphaerota archaeon]MDG6931692.1 purine/pyrimidine permease [Nitrososphaerota archaeon]MDG6936740.1 purine/pyrimidine permease [Nitrososphaerota archaeon]
MAKSNSNDEALYYHFEDKLSLWEYIVYGFEQLLVMDSVFALPVVLGVAFHLPSANLIYLIQAVLIGSGITTLLQSAVLLKLPVAQGIGASITGVGVTLAALGVSFSSFISSAIIAIIIIGIFLIPFIPSKTGRKSIIEYLLVLVRDPQVYGVLITIIGVVLIGNAIGLINDSGYKLLPDIGAIITIAAILALIFVFKKGILRFGSIIIGLLIGAVYSYAAGIMNMSKVISYPIFAFPEPFLVRYGAQISSVGIETAMLAVFIATLMLATEAVGVYYTVGDLDHVKVGDSRVRKGLTGEIIGSLIALLIGGMSTTTFAQNVGAVQITRVGARRVFTATGILLVVLGLIPKIGAFIVSIPDAVLGSAFLVIYAMLLITGLRIISGMEWNNKNMLIVAISLAVGLGISSVSAAAFTGMPLYLKAAIISPIVLATLVAIFLNLIVNLIPKWAKRKE